MLKAFDEIFSAESTAFLITSHMIAKGKRFLAVMDLAENKEYWVYRW